MKTKKLTTISITAWTNSKFGVTGNIVTHRDVEHGESEVHFYYNFSRSSVARVLLAQARYFDKAMAVPK